jgi:hypothetical protein
VKKTNDTYLFQALIKNLPTKIYCSHNKSGAYSKSPLPAHIALKKFEFIEFNSKERITIVVFDKDRHKSITALEYFKDIPSFQEWLIDMNIPLPSYICQTTKGFQFGFIIKGFQCIQRGYNPKNSPQQFLSDIKGKYIQYLELDSIASSRDNGIFRNPVKHKYIAYPSKVYNLHDLNNPIKDISFNEEETTFKKTYIPVSKHRKIRENRNNSIFKLCCMEFAYTKPTKTKIFAFANTININNFFEPLPASEIKSITNSIYKRAKDKTLISGLKKAQLNMKKLVKEREKQIIKYFLKCKKNKTKPVKAQLARELGITVQSLNSTYGDFISLKYKI